jgi:PAS domain S-box-containing protein
LNFEQMSRADLLKALETLLAKQAQAQAQSDEQHLVHELQVHQVELEMQNRELREAREALEESRNRYADLYDFAPVAYMTLSDQGVVEELNLTAATLFGCAREHAQGAPFVGLVRLADSKRFFQHLRECAKTQRAVVSEFRLSAQGRVVDVEMVSVPVLGVGGQPRAFRTALSDITRRNLAEAELRDALTWREDLLAMVSHDLKSPLNAIALSAVSMLPDEPFTERRSSRRQIDLIMRSADFMSHMINDLLLENLMAAGRFTLDKSAEVPATLVEEACRLCQPLLEARELRFEREVERDLPALWLDRERVLRVFVNLIGNAAKFSPRNGSIGIAASRSAEGIVFSVRDAGPGIAVDQQPHLFERYWRGDRSPRGLGLGLYIAKAIVVAHGGKIWLESKPGDGSRFSFMLPLD